ncbi:hypothetical protein PR003_g26234 [Phytophthora rubi]|uniref:RxLR effector protein n=1 Tax=Phytophthora rubi TaxID=129364 RepID=A0A6A3HE70_9STRA|nr:hypothetical protein PR002_g28122 [Phytophthora rubi]KAE8983149.1 hypothetical protein PR001_g23526 [Phytophthora rubi]KAE9286734.1 hypothetical protein PR003_g26234 [Phytophthora rubi]
MEYIVVLVSALAGQTMVLATPSSHRGDNKEKITVTQLVFDKMLREASYESWFTKNLRCSRLSFLEIARFLRERGVVFANAAVKQHSYEIQGAVL